MVDRPGLRERKRLAAMRRIQRTALDLFDQHGYAQVTIERIAAAAEVSPSSVYRYFGTKEQVVLWDEYDPLLLARIAEELRAHPPLAAVRRAVSGLFDELVADDDQVHRRVRYTIQEPSVEAASAVQAHQLAEALGRLLAGSLGREHGDLDIQLFSHALVGIAVGAIHYWYESGFQAPLDGVLDRAFETLQQGFRFDG